MHVFWIVALFVLGACIGSFLNVVIYRLPRGQSIVFPGSHCPSCGTPIRWFDNVPLLSWLMLKARCRSCKGRISPRYLVIELLTAILVAGLYVCYYVLRLRDDAGNFADTWPMFVAHATLVCGLLACSAVDIELFIVPLPVMWFCAAAGVAAAAYRPGLLVSPAGPVTAAASVGACLGLVISMILAHFGYIQESFVDADDKIDLPRPPEKNRAKGKGGKSKGRPRTAPDRPTRVGITRADGVNPRVEILRELLYLLPPLGLALAGYLAVTHWPAARAAVEAAVAPRGGWWAPHVASGLGSLLGLLVGGALIWGTRILGTLGFGKEAMGMGDVHILAAVGAVAGPAAAVLTFFAAPVFGLGWAIYLALARGRRELPYGPWLALAALAVMIFYDAFANLWPF